MSINQGQQLEIYSSKHPQEVLLVKLKIDDELDEVPFTFSFNPSKVLHGYPFFGGGLEATLGAVPNSFGSSSGFSAFLVSCSS